MFKHYTVFTVVFFVVTNLYAQDSMIPDISYPYLDKLIASAQNHYPRVGIFKDQVDVAKANVTKAGLSWFDLFTVSYIYQPNNTNVVDPLVTTSGTTNNRYLFNGLQAGISLNLGNVLTKPLGVKVAKANVKIAREEQSEYLITLTSDVKRKYFTYLLNQNLVKIQTRATQDIENSVQQAKYKFQKGEVTFENYNAVLVSASLRTEQKLQAEANLLIAKSDLEAVVGARLEDIK